MSQLNMQAPGGAELALLSRKTFVRAVVAALVIAAGIASMKIIERAGHFTFVKRPMPLSKPLALLSKRLGSPERYIAEGYDENLEEGIMEVLGTHDYLLRTYSDTKKPGDPTDTLKLNLNYYPVGSSSPHVPEICWAGAGMTEATNSRRVFDVAGVRRKDGSVVDVRDDQLSANGGIGNKRAPEERGVSVQRKRSIRGDAGRGDQPVLEGVECVCV